MLKKGVKFGRKKWIAKAYSANIGSLAKRKSNEEVNSDPDEEDKDNMT